MLQSKFFKRLFFSYMIVIMICMFVYTSFIAVQSYRVFQMQNTQEDAICLREAASTIDERLTDAQSAVRTLRYSTSMRKLYMSLKMGTTLDSYAAYDIQNEMSNIIAARGISLYGVMIFANDYSKVYSTSGILYLKEPFVAPDKELPYIYVGTICDLFGFTDDKRYSFNKEMLLYCDDYTYQNSSHIGTVCVMIDVDDVRNTISKLLEDNTGLKVVYGDEVIFSYGDVSGQADVFQESSCNSAITYEFYDNRSFSLKGGLVHAWIYLVIFGITVIFICYAYNESKKYYTPIGHLKQYVEDNSGHSADEMEDIVSGIQNLIGEKNSYREKMLTIAPFAGEGIIHSIVNGTVEKDKIQILSEENYLDLIRPYYMVAAINFALEESTKAEDKLRQKVESVLKTAVETYSTDELGISYYFKDLSSAYIIFNYDTDMDVEEIIYSLHKNISVALSSKHVLVSMGIDTKRDDIGELKEACEHAVRALDGVLRDGRGEVFFYEENSDNSTEYYFPTNYSDKLKMCLDKLDKNGIHELLFDIYKKNLDLNASPDAYRSMIQEFHVSTIKTLREITELKTVHMNIERMDSLATLQETFDYYDAALVSVIDFLSEQKSQTGDDDKLDKEIIEYVDEHYTNQDISLQMLSDKYNVSSKYLVILFKSYFGNTYLQYIQNKRIAKAVSLIKEGGNSLADIAEKCGYTNQLTFRRNFKSVMGVNPSDYAENLNGKK